MTLEEMNIMNKFGVKQRILNVNDKFSKLLFLSVKYKNKGYYIIDDNGIYHGTIVLAELVDLDLDYINSDKTLGEIAKEHSLEKHFEIDGFNITNDVLSDVVDHVRDAKENEIAIIDSNSKKILAILSKQYTFSKYINHKFENGSCRFEFGKQYVSYNTNLNKYSNNINSQTGEDGIIKRIFELIGTTSKYAVEFGGWDGIHLSNTRNLIMEQDFKCLFIEGDSTRIKDGIKNYENMDNVTFYNTYVGFDKNSGELLDDILDKHNVPKEIDFMSIDIDGYDYHVWNSLEKYKPRVIVVEHNPSMSNDILYVNEKNESVFDGSSPQALVCLGMKKGYSLVAATILNCIFVLDEEFEKLGIYDNSLENLKIDTSLCSNEFFQTYSGNILFKSHAGYYFWKDEKFPSTNKFKFDEN